MGLWLKAGIIFRWVIEKSWIVLKIALLVMLRLKEILMRAKKESTNDCKYLNERHYSELAKLKHKDGQLQHAMSAQDY